MTYIDLITLNIAYFLGFCFKSKMNTILAYVLVGVLFLLLMVGLNIAYNVNYLSSFTYFSFGLPILSILIGIMIRLFKLNYGNHNKIFEQQIEKWIYNHENKIL